MGNSRVRAAMSACLIAVAVVTALNGLPALTGSLATDVGVVLAGREPAASTGWMFTDHAPSLCCADFHAGFGGGLVAVLVGGFPLSLVGISLGRRRRRGEAIPGGRWRHVFYGAFVTQAGGVALAGLLLAVTAVEALMSPFGGEAFIFAAVFVPTLICGALALPSWHSVSNPHS